MENIVEKEQMDSLKALSDTNLKISEAKNNLFKLQEEETEYLIQREKKALDRIQKVVDDSKEMVKEANQNYAQIKDLFSEANNFAGKLVKIQEDLKSVFAEFEERNVQWERDIGRQQDDIEDIRKVLKVEKVEIENDKKNIETAQKKLAEQQKKLDSDRGTIERAIERLKNKKI